MARSTAAIFDLDRTLIASSSAVVFQRHLSDAGLGSMPDIPLADAFMKFYEQFGESWVMMQPAKLGARTSKGWAVEDVHRATVAAAEEIDEMVLPFARITIQEHRDAGRLLVLATTSPEPWVAPLAEQLGFDAVVATKWKSEAGSYTGETDGPFVWGRAKADAVRAWAEANNVSLERSYAYSDSYFDSSMLEMVGHPVAVNPDLRLQGVAALKGWPVRHFDKLDGVIKVAGRELQDWSRPFMREEFQPFARFEFHGIDNIPAEGAAIVVFNHRSYFDPAAVGLLMAKSGRSVRGLGKKEVFDVPIVGRLMRGIGGLRVDRGTGSDEPLEAAAEALRGGEVLMLAPEGTIPRGPAFFDPVLKGRWGAARLAAMTGAPVIPVGLWGTEKVWPRSARMPKLPVGSRPLVTVNVGPPVELGREDPDADTEAIMAALVDLLPDEAREHKVPTAEELALTFPPGYKGDPEAELDRRPGFDTERVMSDTNRPAREIDLADRMSEHEALMWNIEKDPWLNPSGGGLFVFDRPIDVDLLRARMRVAVAELPRFTQRVQPGLGRVSTPAWVPDPEFDFNSHFRVMTLPAPGTQRQLLDLAAQLYMEPLDRTRPLWRMIVVEGLESGQGALWTLMHHAISDGIGQLRMAEMFQDVERDVPRSPDIDLEGIVAAAAAAHSKKEAGGDLGSSLAAATAASVGHVARRLAGTARRAAGEVAIWPADPSRMSEKLGDVASMVTETAEQLSHRTEEGEGAPLWRDRSRHRHLEAITVPLDELKTASKAAGTTVNVAFVAAMSDAAVRYHADRGESFDSLNVSFVISTRTDDKAGGNAFTPVLVRLPADKRDTASRLAATAETLDQARESAGRSGGFTALSGVVNLLPTSVVTRTARSQAAKVDIATSNLRGAPIPLFIGGAKVEYSVTMGPLAGTPCNATALSYCNNFDIGLFIDPVAIKEPAAFRQCVVDSFDDLLAEVR